jgi:predicted RNA-binding protein YlxR (DUF448 family)
VRGAGAEVRVDLDAKAEGRGAYVCTRPECADGALAGKVLARAFRAPVTVEQETIDLVRAWQGNASTR